MLQKTKFSKQSIFTKNSKLWNEIQDHVAFIPLHSCDYLKKVSVKINVVTDEGNSRNETWHWTNNEIGVTEQSCLWVWVELSAW